MAKSIEQYKEDAARIGLTEDQVAQIGNPNYKATWQRAIKIKKQLDAREEERLSREAAIAAVAKRKAEPRLSEIRQASQKRSHSMQRNVAMGKAAAKQEAAARQRPKPAKAAANQPEQKNPEQQNPEQSKGTTVSDMAAVPIAGAIWSAKKLFGK